MLSRSALYSSLISMHYTTNLYLSRYSAWICATPALSGLLLDITHFLLPLVADSKLRHSTSKSTCFPTTDVTNTSGLVVGTHYCTCQHEKVESHQKFVESICCILGSAALSVCTQLPLKDCTPKGNEAHCLQIACCCRSSFIDLLSLKSYRR